MHSPSLATQSNGMPPGVLERGGRPPIDSKAGLFEAFQEAGSEVAYPRGTTLFMEDEAPKQVFIVSSGRIKLSISSREGRTIIVRVAGQGVVLGLSAALASRVHEVTAEVIENARVRAIPLKEFLALMQKWPGAAKAATQLILEEYDAVFNDIRRFALPASVAGRLASLLLGWLQERCQTGRREPRLTVSLTHEEIASMTGTSRETVSRVLQQFRRDKVISIKGASLTVLRPEALEQLAA